jgi:hypothetical protein
MNDLLQRLSALLRRASRPLSAALIFCTAGLVCAVFAIGLNRAISMNKSPLVVAVAPSRSASPSPTAPSGPATPSPTAALASCQGAPTAKGTLGTCPSSP